MLISDNQENTHYKLPHWSRKKIQGDCVLQTWVKTIIIPTTSTCTWTQPTWWTWGSESALNSKLHWQWNSVQKHQRRDGVLTTGDSKCSELTAEWGKHVSVMSYYNNIHNHINITPVIGVVTNELNGQSKMMVASYLQCIIHYLPLHYHTHDSHWMCKFPVLFS